MSKIKIPKVYEPSEKNVTNIVAPAGMKESSNYLKLNNYYVKTFFIYTYPRYLSSGWFSPIINMAEMMDISIFIHPMDTATTLKKLRSKVSEIEAQISEEEHKGLVTNPQLETAYQDIESLRRILQQGTEKMFRVGVYITVYGSNIETLSTLENDITSALESKLIYVKPSLFRQLAGFKTALPLCNDELQINTPLNTDPTSSLFPFVSPDLTSDEGIMYGVNLHNNGLVIFDRFDLENANSVVFAKSGAGKSYATKLEILRTLMMGTDVLVIDPEEEYQALADAVGGSFFKISLTSPNNINPFDIPIIPEGENPENVFKSHVLNLTGLIKLMLGEIKPEEESIIDRVLIETYAARDITAENFGKQTMDPPILEDFQTVLSSTEGGEVLAQRLEKYVHGSYSGFTNSPTDVDMTNRFIVFSIRDLEEELRPVAMYIVLNFVWNLIRAKLKRRLLIIDEAWLMMEYEDSASFLFRLSKRARKYYLGLTTITQNVEDFMNSKYGKPIVTNSALQLLMKQSPASVKVLANTFDLTRSERRFLLEAEVGEGLFFVGLKHVAIKIIPSYTEDKIITTNPEEILKSHKKDGEA